jgi:hypothetical protein
MEVHFPCQHIAHSSARSLEGTSLDAVTDRSVKWFHTRHGPLERWVLPFHSHRQTDLRNRGLGVRNEPSPSILVSPRRVAYTQR